MAWYHQATSHYLNQCWPRSMSPYGGVIRPQRVHLLVSRRCGGNFKCVISKHMLWLSSWALLVKMAQNIIDDMSTLVQAMTWCLSQCWSRFMSPYAVTRPRVDLPDYLWKPWRRKDQRRGQNPNNPYGWRSHQLQMCHDPNLKQSSTISEYRSTHFCLSMH